MQKSILIFGGSGFLGSYLVDSCLEAGFNVTIADINEPQDAPDCQFIKTDVTDFESVQNAVDRRYDAAFNFAGFANLDKASKDPINTMQMNILGNTYCLEACKNKNVGHYLYAGSAYALCTKGSFYGISKHASEKIVEEYATQYSMQYTIVRFGSVYSEKESDNNYLYNLVKSAIESGEIRHAGDGNEQREYIHAKDCAELSLKMICNPEFFNKHVMLTGNDRMTKGELFHAISEMLEGKVNIVYERDKVSDFHYKYTPYSFRPELGFKLAANPYVDFGQGILKCIEAVYKKKETLKEIL